MSSEGNFNIQSISSLLSRFAGLTPASEQVLSDISKAIDFNSVCGALYRNPIMPALIPLIALSITSIDEDGDEYMAVYIAKCFESVEEVPSHVLVEPPDSLYLVFPSLENDAMTRARDAVNVYQKAMTEDPKPLRFPQPSAIEIDEIIADVKQQIDKHHDEMHGLRCPNCDTRDNLSLAGADDSEHLCRACGHTWEK